MSRQLHGCIRDVFGRCHDSDNASLCNSRNGLAECRKPTAARWTLPGRICSSSAGFCKNYNDGRGRLGGVVAVGTSGPPTGHFTSLLAKGGRSCSVVGFHPDDVRPVTLGALMSCAGVETLVDL